ncbi:universal stress protein [Mycolicibacterium sp. 050158]|uniref:universal stress protein n=1 Tax=Mycolicibacterium sp. 050158 TaxID=3090602 RepID=UPI00299E56AD|nr:universal stress protein [Mycolicibacterium sp. 050158]MDX1890778.1 universal stress protein [Mycolicibacterium sp. 050158]
MTIEQRAHPVVVGVDGTAEAIDAARWAAGLAMWHGQPLHLVYALSGVDEALLILTSAQQEDAGEYPRHIGQAVLDRAADAVHAEYPTLHVKQTLSHRSPTDALLEHGSHARLIVLACADVSAGGALLVGSTTLSVATRATCPVVAWRGNALAPNDLPVIVGVDEGRVSDTALLTAFELADCLGVGLTAVNAVSPRREVGDVDLPILLDWSALEDEARQRLRTVVDPIAARWPGVRVSHVVEVGKASRVLLGRAFGAQLVVVGSRGRGGVASALLGSTGLSLLHHSPTPVVICPSARAEEPTSSQAQRSGAAAAAH